MPDGMSELDHERLEPKDINKVFTVIKENSEQPAGIIDPKEVYFREVLIRQIICDIESKEKEEQSYYFTDAHRDGYDHCLNDMKKLVLNYSILSK